MGWRFFCLALLIATKVVLANSSNGACKKDPASSTLPVISCRAPVDCLSGDCLPPQIDKHTASIDYGEPTFSWNEFCKGTHKNCWDMHIPISFRLAASDPSGVREVGFELRTEAETLYKFERHFATAATKDSAGRYLVNHTLALQLPPGGNIDFSVYQLCARDGAGNEGCVVPTRAN